MSAAGRSAAAATGHVRHADDFYETPDWCTKAILPHLFDGPIPNDLDVLDPCAGRGAILKIIQGGRRRPRGIEIDGRRAADCRRGFDLMSARISITGVPCDLGDALTAESWDSPDLVITNPPYALAMEFVTRALDEIDECGGQAAFLLRLNWLASQKRAKFHKECPSDIFILPRRPSFTEDGKTDATEYAWFVWGPGRGNRWWILDV